MQAEATVNFIVEMNKRHTEKAKRIAMVYENSDFGQSVAAGLKRYMENAGFEIAVDEPYPAKLADLTPIVTKVKIAGPDVVVRVQYVSDAILFARTVGEQKLDVMGIIGPGGGETDPTYIPAVGDFGDYHFTNPAYTPTLPYALPWLAPINDGFKAQYGRDITTNAVHGIFNMYFIKDVLERAKSIDPKKVRDAMAATDIKAGKLPWFLFPFEGLRFDEHGQNIYAWPTMSQYLGKKLYAVWPDKYQLKGKEIVWPMPAWAER